MSKICLLVLIALRRMMIGGAASAQDEGCPMGAVVADAPVIKLGAAVSQTGNFSNEGGEVYNGYLLWQEWVNQEHGGINVGGVCHQVHVVFYDDESDRDKLVELTNQLIAQDQVNFILGPYLSGFVQASSDVSEAAGVIMVQAGGASETLYTRGYQNLFGVLTPASKYTQSGIELAAAQGAKTAVVVYEDSVFATSVAAGAEGWLAEYGIELLASEAYPEDSTDLTDLFTRMATLQPDLVIGGGNFTDSVLFVQTAKVVNLTPEAFLITVAPSSPVFVEQLGTDAEFIWGASQWESSMAWEDPWFGTAADYAARYNARFDKPPSYIAAQATATPLTLQLAIEAAGSLETDAVRTALQDLDVVTFYGPINFDETGSNADKPMATVQIQNGVVVVIAPADAAVAEALYPMPAWGDR